MNIFYRVLVGAFVGGCIGLMVATSKLEHKLNELQASLKSTNAKLVETERRLSEFAPNHTKGE